MANSKKQTPQKPKNGGSITKVKVKPPNKSEYQQFANKYFGGSVSKLKKNMRG